jgi:hypothetical protein
LKASIFIFVLGVLAPGLIFAGENGPFSSRTFTAAEPGFDLGYGSGRMAEHAIDERTIDRLGLFDRSDNGRSSRYSVELNLEHEDSDWSFEVTVMVEF